MVYSETDKACGTVSDLIWPNDLFKELQLPPVPFGHPVHVIAG